MKTTHVFLLFVAILFVFIIFARSCHDEESEYIESDEFVDSISSEHSYNEKFELCDPTPNEIQNGIELEWPDSIFVVVKGETYLSELDKEVIIELNKCRTNPSKYAEMYLKPIVSKMDKAGCYINSEGFNVKSQEGKSAIEEAISVLEIEMSLPMLRPKIYLCKAALDHCNDQGPRSLVGHGGSDGSSPSSRVKRYFSNFCGIGENIDYGNATAQEIVCSLIIDDGVPDRGHRKNIFNRKYLNVGVANGFHKAYRNMCVIDFESN